ncbi:hypothetical protein AACH06_08670 [Ideonella sp. DXS29W]|uniref:Thioredoxin domain-containing protein n=1 Tax=Ideonella lacteola TaxID=2984193 RepID=A0ABU9BQV5_9BURK
MKSLLAVIAAVIYLLYGLPVEAATAEAAPTSVCSKAFMLATDKTPEEHLHCLSSLKKQDKKLRLFKDRDLDQMISAVYKRSMLTGSSADADTMRILVEEGKRRHPRDHSADDLIFGTLLAAGRVEDAEKAPFEHAPTISREPLPPSALISGHSRYWAIEEDPFKLVEGQVDLRSGIHVVVYAAPGCHFCEAASQDIAKNEALGALFRSRSIWINVPNSNYAVDYYQTWQIDKYSYPMNIVFDRSGWPSRNLGATPYFFLMKDGQVVGTLLGWQEGSMTKLVKLLSENQLLN